MEIDNGTINFLDVMVLIDGERIKFDLYKKSTNLGRYLKFHSNHPLKNVIKCL